MKKKKYNNMNYKKLDEKLNFVINELRKDDAGEEITDFNDYEDALRKIKEKYDKGEFYAYCPNATKISYDNNEYELAVVLGIAKETKSGMKPHGMAHYLSKYTYTDKDKLHPTAQELLYASKNVNTAIKEATKNKTIFI